MKIGEPRNHPVTMATALDPSIGTEWSAQYIDVETAGELTRGMTIVDGLNVAACREARKFEVNDETLPILFCRNHCTLDDFAPLPRAKEKDHH